MQKNLFRNKNFMLVYFGALVSNVGAMFYSFAVSYYILEITDNNGFLQGLYLALTGVIYVVVSLFGGVLSDRMNKAKIMYACDFIKGALILISTLIMALSSDLQVHVVVLFALGILGNVVSAFFSPASASILPFIVEEEQFQKANSLFSILSSFQSIVGVILAGLLYSLLNVQTLFCIVGACYFCSAVSELFIRYTYVGKEEKLSVRKVFSDLKDGFVYLGREKAILSLLTVIIFINFFFAPVFNNFIPYFIATDVKGSGGYLFDDLFEPEFWNSVFTVFLGIGSLIAGLVFSARNPKEKCSAFVKRALAGMSLLFLSVAFAYLFFVHLGDSLNAFLITVAVVCFLCGILIVLINVPISTTIQKVVAKDQLGKVNSVLSAMSQGLIPVANLLAGAVIASFGCTPLLFVCSIGFIGATAVLILNKEVKKL